jgi:hypothetical protein
MAYRAVGRDSARRVTVDAKAHVDFMDWHDSIHRPHIAVTFLTLNAGIDVRLMREANEIGKRVNAIPLDLEWRPLVVSPWTRHRLDAADHTGAVTSDASRDWWSASGLRSSRILVAVLTRNLIDAGVNAMTERNRLLHIGSGSPRTLRKSEGAESDDQQCDRQGQQRPVH